MKKVFSLISICLVICFSLLKLGCIKAPNDLILPQWDVDLNIPFFNTTYSLSDIVDINKTSYISISETSPNDSIYIFQSDNYTQEVGVSQFIKAIDSTSSENQIVKASNTNSTILYLQFPNHVELDSATFQSGTFAYTIKNPSAVPVTVILTIPGISSPDGTVLSMKREIPPLMTIDSAIDFSHFKYNLPGNQPPFYKNSLQIVMDVQAQVTAGTSVDASFYAHDFYFESVSGYLPKKSLGKYRRGFAINLGDVVDYRDKTFLGDATLNLVADYITAVSNPFDIGVNNLNIIGKRNDGSTFYLKDKTGNPDINFIFSNGHYLASFNKSNSNITNFISFLPDSVLLVADYVMNPDNKTGSATIHDTVKFSANFKTDSHLALKKSTITDTTKVDWTPDERDKIRNGREIKVTVEVENGIPLTTWMNVSLVDSNYNPLFTIKNLASGTDSLYFSGADVDQNGDVIKSVTTDNKVVLDLKQIEQLSHAAHLILSVSVRSKNAFQTPSPFVTIRPNDTIHIRVFGGVKYHLNPSNSN